LTHPDLKQYFGWNDDELALKKKQMLCVNPSHRLLNRHGEGRAAGGRRRRRKGRRPARGVFVLALSALRRGRGVAEKMEEEGIFSSLSSLAALIC